MKTICLPMAFLSIFAAVIILVASPSPGVANGCLKGDHEHYSEK